MKGLAFVLLLSLGSAGWLPPIRDVIEKGGEGTYRCSYKGIERTEGCRVVVRTETVTHPALLKFNGLPDGSSMEAETISITWPSRKTAKFAWSDSKELVLISSSKGWGYSPAFLPNEWPELDWSRGFVVFHGKSEFVRLW